MEKASVVGLCTVLGLTLMAACCSAQPVTSAFDEAPVTLTIEKFCWVNIVKDTIEMNTVKSDWFHVGFSRSTTGTSPMEARTNFDAEIRAPKEITLSDTVEYHPKATVSFITGNWVKGEDATHTYILVPKGDWTFLGDPPGYFFSLQVEIEKEWTVNDPAGVYTGPLTVEMAEKGTWYSW